MTSTMSIHLDVIICLKLLTFRTFGSFLVWVNMSKGKHIMPVYIRHCDSCDEIFDVTCKIAEKDSLQPTCPTCHSTDGEWRISSPHFSMRSERFMTHKKDAGFQEVIHKIQERNKRTEISKR